MTMPKNCKKNRCIVCEKEYRPTDRNQKYCSHKCAFKIIGDKVRLAASKPESRIKMANTKRGRGRGVSYMKWRGRHYHRVVAEFKIGRDLKPGEIVHHIDENIRNNHPDNLQVLPDRATHANIHGLGNKGVHFKKGHQLTKGERHAHI